MRTPLLAIVTEPVLLNDLRQRMLVLGPQASSSLFSVKRACRHAYDSIKTTKLLARCHWEKTGDRSNCQVYML